MRLQDVRFRSLITSIRIGTGARTANRLVFFAEMFYVSFVRIVYCFCHRLVKSYPTTTDRANRFPTERYHVIYGVLKCSVRRLANNHVTRDFNFHPCCNVFSIVSPSRCKPADLRVFDSSWNRRAFWLCLFQLFRL